MSEREIVFWAPEDADELSCDDLDEAIQDALEEMDELPVILEMWGYARMQPTPPGGFTDWALEDLLEMLDGEYGDPDNTSTPTEAMRKAAETFVASVLKEYVVWMCEPVEKRTINVAEWIQENRPVWIDQEPPQGERP